MEDLKVVDDEIICCLCIEDECPKCEDPSDIVGLCPECGYGYHECCSALHSWRFNIGLKNLFRCVNCGCLIKLDEANVYLANSSIWIRPYIYPLNSNQHYAGAQQRLYFSATIGEPADLCRRLGVRKIVKMAIPPDHSQRTSGRRLIVMNRIEDRDLPERLQHAFLVSLRRTPKSIWMFSSRAVESRVAS